MAGAPRLGQLLVSLGFLDQAQLERALQRQRERGQRLGKVLVESAMITEDRLVHALSRQLNIETCDPVVTPVHERVLALVPREVAFRHRVLPLARKKDGDAEVLFLATADPLDQAAMEGVRQALGPGMRLQWLLAGETEIEQALSKHYGQAPAASDDPAPRAPAPAPTYQGVPVVQGLPFSGELPPAAAPSSPPEPGREAPGWQPPPPVFAPRPQSAGAFDPDNHLSYDAFQADLESSTDFQPLLAYEPPGGLPAPSAPPSPAPPSPAPPSPAPAPQPQAFASPSAAPSAPQLPPTPARPEETMELIDAVEVLEDDEPEEIEADAIQSLDGVEADGEPDFSTVGWNESDGSTPLVPDPDSDADPEVQMEGPSLELLPAVDGGLEADVEASSDEVPALDAFELEPIAPSPASPLEPDFGSVPAEIELEAPPPPFDATVETFSLRQAPPAQDSGPAFQSSSGNALGRVKLLKKAVPAGAFADDLMGPSDPALGPLPPGPPPPAVASPPEEAGFDEFTTFSLDPPQGVDAPAMEAEDSVRKAQAGPPGPVELASSTDPDLGASLPANPHDFPIHAVPPAPGHEPTLPLSPKAEADLPSEAPAVIIPSPPAQSADASVPPDVGAEASEPPASPVADLSLDSADIEPIVPVDPPGLAVESSEPPAPTRVDFEVADAAPDGTAEAEPEPVSTADVEPVDLEDEPQAAETAETDDGFRARSVQTSDLVQRSRHAIDAFKNGGPSPYATETWLRWMLAVMDDAGILNDDRLARHAHWLWSFGQDDEG